MTTLRLPSSRAVRVAVPLAPLPFTSTSFAFTVVSAEALVGTHIKAEAAASMRALRNLIMYHCLRLGAPVCSVAILCPTIRPPVSAADVFGHRGTSRIVGAAHLYITPELSQSHPSENRSSLPSCSVTPVNGRRSSILGLTITFGRSVGSLQTSLIDVARLSASTLAAWGEGSLLSHRESLAVVLD